MGSSRWCISRLRKIRPISVGFKNMLALHKQGCDYGARMIARARHNQIRPWISVRMNDAHNVDWPDHPAHSTDGVGVNGADADEQAQQGPQQKRPH